MSRVQLGHKPATHHGQRNTSGLASGQDIDIFEDDDDDNAPGPGAYYNPKSMSSFNAVNRKPGHLQFFGSTVDRFTHVKPSSTTDLSNNIGPGSY